MSKDWALIRGFAGYAQNSPDTAAVQVGVIDRSMIIRTVSRKVKFMPWDPLPGRFFCIVCRKFFTPLMGYEPIQHRSFD